MNLMINDVKYCLNVFVADKLKVLYKNSNINKK